MTCYLSAVSMTSTTTAPVRKALATVSATRAILFVASVATIHAFSATTRREQQSSMLVTMASLIVAKHIYNCGSIRHSYNNQLAICGRRRVRSYNNKSVTYAFVPAIQAQHDGHIEVVFRPKRLCLTVRVRPTQTKAYKDSLIKHVMLYQQQDNGEVEIVLRPRRRFLKVERPTQRPDYKPRRYVKGFRPTKTLAYKEMKRLEGLQVVVYEPKDALVVYKSHTAMVVYNPRNVVYESLCRFVSQSTAMVVYTARTLAVCATPFVLPAAQQSAVQEPIDVDIDDTWEDSCEEIPPVCPGAPSKKQQQVAKKSDSMAPQRLDLEEYERDYCTDIVIFQRIEIQRIDNDFAPALDMEDDDNDIPSPPTATTAHPLRRSARIAATNKAKGVAVQLVRRSARLRTLKRVNYKV